MEPTAGDKHPPAEASARISERAATEASPFLAPAASNASAALADDATTIDVAKPLTRSVVSPLYAEDGSSGDESDSSFSSRLLDHGGGFD